MSECPVSSGARESSTGNSVYSSDHAGEGLSVCVCVCVCASTCACVCVTGLPQEKGLKECVLGLIPGWGRSPGEGNGNPLQYSCLENPTDRGAWRAAVHGAAESDVTEHAHTCVVEAVYCVSETNTTLEINYT